MEALKKKARHFIMDTAAVNIPLWLRRDALTIFCVHGVTRYARMQRTANFEGRHIHRRAFDEMLEYVMRHFNPISLEQLDGHYYRGNPLPRNPVFLTFDDGFANNYYQAFHSLKRYGCPAAVFLATGYIDNRSAFWVEHLEYSIFNTALKRLKITLEGHEFELFLETFSEKEAAFRTLLRFLKNGFSLSKVSGLSAEICGRLGFPDPAGMDDNEDYNFLTWDQVRTMSDAGIDFGAHTVNHVNLTHENIEKARWEIQTSRAEIEKRLGRQCTAFCYPFGRSGYNPELEIVLKESGFRFSFQLGGGLNDADTNPMLLNRIPLMWGSRPDRVFWDILRK